MADTSVNKRGGHKGRHAHIKKTFFERDFLKSFKFLSLKQLVTYS